MAAEATKQIGADDVEAEFQSVWAAHESIRDGEWAECKSNKNIKVFTQEQPAGQAIRIVKAVTTIKAPFDLVKRILTDYSIHCDWDKGTQEIKELHRFSETCDVCSVITAGTFGLSQRYYVYFNWDVSEEGKTTLVSRTLEEGEFSEWSEIPQGLVLGSDVTGSAWMVEQLPENELRISYIGANNPRGWLPSAAINIALPSAYLDLLSNVRKEITKQLDSST